MYYGRKCVIRATLGKKMNSDKEAILKEAYSDLEYVFFYDLCNEWDLDDESNLARYLKVKQLTFPSPKDLHQQYLNRIFCAWVNDDYQLGTYPAYLTTENERQYEQQVIQANEAELAGDIYCLRCRRMACEYLLIKAHPELGLKYSCNLFNPNLDLVLVEQQLDVLADVYGYLALCDIDLIIPEIVHRCFTELMQFIIQYPKDYQAYLGLELS